MDNFYFSGPNLPKNEFWDRNIKNLSPDSESVPPRYYVCLCSVRMDNFKIFGLNLGKLPNCMQHFGFNNLEVLQRVEWRLKCAELRWMELDEDGWKRVKVDGWWRRVHSLATNIYILINETGWACFDEQ